MPLRTIRVGVTGHRPQRLVKADPARLRGAVDEVLDLVCRTVFDAYRDAGSAYSPDPPLLRVVSALAEGSDRIVANAALRLGFELQCSLPFDVESYQHDFGTEESCVEFRR